MIDAPYLSVNPTDVYEEIKRERSYQDSKWGMDFDNRNTRNDWAIYICRYAANAITFGTDLAHFRELMVKVAALAVAAIEAVDRLGNKFPNRHYDREAESQ